MDKKSTHLNKEVFTSLVRSDSVTKSKVRSIWREFDRQFLLCTRAEGKVTALNRYKECYSFLRNNILDLEYSLPAFIKVDSNGIPKPLWPLRALINGDRNSQRIALTIARTWESINLDPVPNLLPITSERRISWRTKMCDESFQGWIEAEIPMYKWLRPKPYTKRFTVWDSNGSGPNGPAVAWSLADLIPLKSSPKLWDSIQSLNTIYNRQVLNIMMNTLIPDENLNKLKQWVHSKIGFISEPGGKTRLFSIFDYWSQSALIPLHHQLMEILRSIDCDSTHDQNQGFSKLIKRSNGSPCFCFDLSSATDRIPAFQQELIISVLFGKPIAKAWISVMTDRNFLMPNKTLVRWKVGQPLGALTSFPAFALWHHMVVQYAHYTYLVGKMPSSFEPGDSYIFPWFNKYMLLGDDIVIWDENVALFYQMMMDDLGLEINLKKTVIGRSKSQLEFLKRISLGGLEMSSIKYTLMSKDSEAFAVDLIDILFTRDFIEPVIESDKWIDLLPKGNRFNLFKVIIWFRYLTSPSLHLDRKGKMPLVLERTTFENKLLEVRQTILTEKTMEVHRILDENISLESLYHKWGAPYRKGTLGEASLTATLSPIVWVINQTGEILNDTLSELHDPESVKSVEYIPIISNKRYFKKRSDNNVYLSKVYLRTFKEYSNDFDCPNEDK
uniref:RdRp n=1 Tax=viral metagenome TaxID=1070528 RepID=A0A2V0RBW5_9ZZZZ